MKQGFAFVDYEDERDADDAVRDMDGVELDGSRIRVELARGRDRRGGGGDFRRDDRGGGRAPDTMRCFTCNQTGAPARRCRRPLSHHTHVPRFF
jgi:RNA recognition motif-containing protein